VTEEEILIAQCQAGDKVSQFALVKKHSGMLLTVCRRYARDDAMAQDLVQETFILIFSNIKKYKATGSFEAWMRRIAINCSLQMIGRSYFKNEQNVAQFTPSQLAANSDPKIFSQLATEEIIKLIQTLPDGYRTVLNLYIIEGFSHQEIADALDISINTSRSQLLRARKKLIIMMTDFPKQLLA